ncbi:MAG TPA: metal ABC transporter permease [Phycisphaerales bacterium]|nr:metal ABC transporter permease [Phycisphaerales bacterium]
MAADHTGLLVYLRDPIMRNLLLPGVLAGAFTVVTCAILSPLVVVRRLGFIGQGISHSAFGGVGVAAVLAAFGLIAVGGAAEFAVIAVFCIAAALGMGLIADRRRTPEDSTIGLFLVGSMALGALLFAYARDHALSAGRAADTRSWESILFGSVMNAGGAEVLLAAIVMGVVLLTLGLIRRPLLFWAFDEEAARGFGVPGGPIRAGLMIMLALVVVAAMKTAGVVLASALLVLPGATALRLSDRLGRVIAISLATALVGLIGGMALSIDRDWQPGPCVVLVMTGMFVAALVWSSVRSPRGHAGAAQGG